MFVLCLYCITKHNELSGLDSLDPSRNILLPAHIGQILMLINYNDLITFFDTLLLYIAVVSHGAGILYDNNTMYLRLI